MQTKQKRNKYAKKLFYTNFSTQINKKQHHRTVFIFIYLFFAYKIWVFKTDN